MKKISLTIATGILAAAITTGCTPKTDTVTTSSAVETETTTTAAVETTTQAPPKDIKKEQASAWYQAAYAMITVANQGDISIMGGFEKNDENTLLVRDLLNGGWGVTDRPSAEETLKWLVDTGHRESFVNEMGIFKDMGLSDMPKEEAIATLRDMDMTEKQAACYLAMLGAYETYGAQAIDAWDYSRALQLLGWYYVADYYTEDEVMAQSLEIGKKLQSQYKSWDEMAQSYLLGYNYWAEEDPEAADSNTAARRKIYEDLKAQADSPYKLDWTTPLE